MPTPLPTLHDWRLSVDYEGIAWALMDREGERVNSMGRRLTEELGEIVNGLRPPPSTARSRAWC